MSGVGFRAVTSEVALVAATVKTVIQIAAPANQRVIVTGWGVFFDGASPTAEPVQVELLRQTTGGTMSALTLVKTNSSDSETLQTAATHTATAEPTAGDVLDALEVHPQTGYEKDNQYIPVPGGTRLGIRCTAPAGVNVRAKIFAEE